jgi:outer membrane protein assembly factor BamB
MAQFTIEGRIVDILTRDGIARARVEAWDKDLAFDDLVGATITHSDGSFRMVFDEQYFAELFEQGRPDLYFRVFIDRQCVRTTERDVLWNVDAGTTQLVIEVDVNAQPKPELPPEPEPEPPVLLPGSPSWSPDASFTIERVPLPGKTASLTALDLAVSVAGPERFPVVVLRVPFTSRQVSGVEVESLRMFRWDPATERWSPVWASGVDREGSVLWVKLRRPGVYAPIGLPRDRLLHAVLRQLAIQRRHLDDDPEAARELARHLLRPFTDLPDAALAQLRRTLTRMEMQTSTISTPLTEVIPENGGHILYFPLPGGRRQDALRKWLVEWQHESRPLPEEQLFFEPDMAMPRGLPWPTKGDAIELPYDRELRELEVSKYIDLSRYFPWLSTDWPMYQHDRSHSGEASGVSGITSTSAHRLGSQWTRTVAGQVVTKPAIVGGYVYIGTAAYGGADQAVMYKLKLSDGTVAGSFPISDSQSAFYSYQGVGGTPAIVSGRVYFTTVNGRVYCLRTSDMTLVWSTSLKTADAAKLQPINNPHGDSWSSPVVVNGRVYVASGEGESASPCGFVWCLEASTGNLNWAFCTNKFVNPDTAGSENAPKVIPRSLAISDPLPSWAVGLGYVIHDDPPHRGSAPWSSCAYDAGLQRIYICTGNSRPDTPLPDERYASGLLALDANTGTFAGFFQPAPSDAYWPNEFDVDVPCAPTLYTDAGTRVVAFGSKNGSFFVLDANTLAVRARRQLLARINGSGLPGDYGTADSSVVPIPAGGENKWGVMGTAALHAGTQRLFVGLGGYSGVAGYQKTPFMRALSWHDLTDAWPTALGPDGITRYTVATPPLYQSSEAGLSSPAVVNDVVFMSTSKTALYAFDVNTGNKLWQASGLPAGGWPIYALGPAVSGDYVVMGADHQVRCWKLRLWWIPDLPIEWPIERWWPWPDPPWPWPGPWPGPGPGPDPGPWFEQAVFEPISPWTADAPAIVHDGIDAETRAKLEARRKT